MATSTLSPEHFVTRALRLGAQRFIIACIEHLTLHELGEQAPFRQELVVGAFFGYAPAIDHQDAIAMPHGREPMRNHHARAGERIERVAHVFLRRCAPRFTGKKKPPARCSTGREASVSCTVSLRL